MKIDTINDFGKALRSGPYAWPGGYPIFFLTSDGGALSFASAWMNRKIIARAIADNDHGGWRVVASDVNWEDAELFDDDSGNRIESAYAEDGAKGETDKIPADYEKWRKHVIRKGTFS